MSSSPPKDDLSLLLKALYSEADQLEPRDWQTTHWLAFQRLCSTPASRSEGWGQALDQITQRVQQAWENYRNLQVTDRERTAETVAGHRLLLEGLEGWLGAVDLCREGDFETALEVSAEANRLLVMVQKQGRRLSQSLNSVPRPRRV